jgi:hypothetical protein
MEQDNLFNQSYGTISQWQEVNNNGTWSWKFQSLGFSGNFGPNVNGTVKSLIAPADPSGTDVPGANSYLANSNALQSWGKQTFLKISDGTSNTIFYSEGYYNCQGGATWAYGPKSRLGAWNTDPAGSTWTNGQYQQTGEPAFSPYQYNWSTSPLKYQTFQIKPLLTKCDPNVPQALYSGGLLVGLGDGSVRMVSSSISPSTWNAALTPSSGDQLGNDW